MNTERITYNGQEVSIDELKHIFRLLAKMRMIDNNYVNKILNEFNSLSEGGSLHKWYWLAKDYLKESKCQDFLSYISSDIIERRYVLLKEYLDENNAWEKFVNNVWIFVEKTHGQHDFSFTQTPKEIIKLYLLRTKCLCEVIDYAFSWADTIEGRDYWGQLDAKFVHWLRARGFDPWSYSGGN